MAGGRLGNNDVFFFFFFFLFFQSFGGKFGCNWVIKFLRSLSITNLVPRSHSVTRNVRSGKVRQYTIFHWLLKKGCGNAIYAQVGLFRGALSEGLVLQAHVLF